METKILIILLKNYNKISYKGGVAKVIFDDRFEEIAEEIVKLLSQSPPKVSDEINVSKLPPLENANKEKKDKLIKDFIELTSKHTMELFYSLGLKTHIESRVVNKETNEEFIFSFKKVSEVTEISDSDIDRMAKEVYPELFKRTFIGVIDINEKDRRIYTDGIKKGLSIKQGEGE